MLGHLVSTTVEMVCECGAKTRVLETRFRRREDVGPIIFRRRQCLECGSKFVTYEVRLDYDPDNEKINVCLAPPLD